MALRIIPVASFLFLACLVFEAAAAGTGNRKLLGGLGQQLSGPYYYRSANQLAAQQIAATTTRQAIYYAVDNDEPGAQFGATRAATGVGQATSTLAAADPCLLTGGCWPYGRYRYYNPRRRH